MPEATLTRRFSGGWVTQRDPSELRSDELVVATGIYYPRGDKTRAHKVPGRSLFGDTGVAGKVKGLALLQYDTAADKIVAFNGTTLYEATAGTSGVFASGDTGVTGTKLDTAHYEDKWYLVTGTVNRVRESDGTYREPGMEAPASAPVATQLAAGTTTNGSGSSGGENAANAIDADLNTFAHATLSAAGSSSIIVNFPASQPASTSDHKAYIKWSLTGTQADGGHPNRSRLADTGADARPGYNVTVKLELSEDAGGSYTTFLNWTLRSPQTAQTALQDVTDALNSQWIRLRATLTYNFGTSPATLRVYEGYIQDAPGEAVFSTTGSGFLYAFTEYDQTRGLESPLSPETARVTFTDKNNVKLTLPAPDDNKNSNTTHYKIYRTVDGGVYQDIGVIGQAAAASGASAVTFIDDFLTYGKDEQPLTTSRLFSVQGSDQAKLWFPMDAKPPALRRIGYHEGSLWGMTLADRREIRWSIPGYPESWPEVYFIGAFPMEEHDQLVDAVSIGGILVLGATGLMMRIDELPRSIAGQFVASAVEPIAGAPGLVGDYAMTKMRMGGESYVGWISPVGVFATNGYQVHDISLDFDWDLVRDMDKSGFVLHWDADLQALIFCYSSLSGFGNDRYAIIHMDPSQRTPDGQPKWTGPHYGSITQLASGLISNRMRAFSGHFIDGKVYLDRNPTTGADASNAYSASPGDSPLVITTAKDYSQWDEYSVHESRLRHTDFGSGQSATVAYTTGRDANGFSSTKSSAVSLSGDKGTQFRIGRRGEHHQLTITHNGTGLGALLDFTTRAQTTGRAGKKKPS